MSIPLPHIPVGGRLHHFLPKWKQITSDCEVLDMITGMHIDLLETPHQYFQPAPLNFSQEEIEATNRLISELVLKNAIEPCESEPGEYVSHIFLCRKPNGSYCMILDLSSFN